MTAPWNTVAPLRAYLRRARAPASTERWSSPRFIATTRGLMPRWRGIVAASGGRLMGFAFVHSSRDAGRIFTMVEHAVRQWGFCGIKVHGSDAMPTREVCEAARAFHLPILVDVIGQAAVIEMFADAVSGRVVHRPASRQL